MSALLSVAEYHQLGEFDENGYRTELIRGIIIEKMSKSPLQYSMMERVREILAGQMQPGWLIRQEGPLTLSDSEPEPDLAVVYGSRGAFDSAHPTTAQLAIEVAVTSIGLDRAKANLYSQAGVSEYWIICPQEKRVEVYRGPGASGYAECSTFASPAVLECGALPWARLSLAELFA